MPAAISAALHAAPTFSARVSGLLRRFLTTCGHQQRRVSDRNDPTERSRRHGGVHRATHREPLLDGLVPVVDVLILLEPAHGHLWGEAGRVSHHDGSVAGAPAPPALRAPSPRRRCCSYQQPAGRRPRHGRRRPSAGPAGAGLASHRARWPAGGGGGAGSGRSLTFRQAQRAARLAGCILLDLGKPGRGCLRLNVLKAFRERRCRCARKSPQT